MQAITVECRVDLETGDLVYTRGRLLLRDTVASKCDGNDIDRRSL